MNNRNLCCGSNGGRGRRSFASSRRGFEVLLLVQSGDTLRQSVEHRLFHVSHLEQWMVITQTTEAWKNKNGRKRAEVRARNELRRGKGEGRVFNPGLTACS